MSVVFRIELERETDGRWIAEVVELPGVLAYGVTQDDAIAHVQALARRRRPPQGRRCRPRVPEHLLRRRVSDWLSTRAKLVLAGLLRIAWQVERQTGSHRPYALSLRAGDGGVAGWGQDVGANAAPAR